MFLSLLGCHNAPPAQQPLPAVVSSSPVPAAIEPPSPTRRELFEALPRSGPPTIGYTLGATYVAPNGQRTRLRLGYRHGGVNQLVRYEGGFLVADDRIFEGTTGLHRLTSRGGPIWRACGSTRLFVDAHADRVAYQIDGPKCDYDGVLGPAPTVGVGTLVPSGERRTLIGDDEQLAGLLADEVVLSNLRETAHYLQSADGLRRRLSADSPLSDSDSQQRLLTLGSRHSGVDCETRMTALPRHRTLWVGENMCAVALSPNGRTLLVLDGNEFAVVASRSGRRLWAVGSLRALGQLDTPVWETNDSLLAVLHQGSSAAIVRINDARVSRVTPMRKVHAINPMALETTN